MVELVHELEAELKKQSEQGATKLEQVVRRETNDTMNHTGSHCKGVIYKNMS